MALQRSALGTAVVLGFMIAALIPAVAQQQSPVPVRVVISGEVLPIQLVRVDQVVKEGEPIVFVKGATAGAAVPAAVAPVNGRVVQVGVRPGDHVNIGDVVAVIQPQ